MTKLNINTNKNKLYLILIALIILLLFFCINNNNKYVLLLDSHTSKKIYLLAHTTLFEQITINDTLETLKPKIDKLIAVSKSVMPKSQHDYFTYLLTNVETLYQILENLSQKPKISQEFYHTIKDIQKELYVIHVFTEPRYFIILFLIFFILFMKVIN
jgi:hypothetical protein